MRRAAVWVLGVVAAVVVLVAATSRRDAAPVDVDWRLFRPSPPTVAVGLPTRGPIARTVAAKGVVEPVHQAQVVAKVAGKVAEVCVEEGAAVRRGDVLVRLDDATFRSRADASKARLDTAIKNLDIAEAHLRDVEKDASAATTPATPAAPSPLAGMPGMAPPLPTPGPSKLDVARDSVEGWRRERKAADAADQAARADLDRTQIRAPLTGVVEDLAVAVGDEVAAAPTLSLPNRPVPVVGGGMFAGLGGGADALSAPPEPTIGPARAVCTILDPDEVRVRAWVDEGDVGLVAAGQPARVYLPDEPTTPTMGRITRVALRGRPTGEVVAYAATIQLDGAGSRARAGMRVNVEVEVSRAEGLLGVPVQAVLHRKRRDLARNGIGIESPGAGFMAVPAVREAEGDSEYIKAVFVVEGDQVRLRPIATGLSDERRVQVVAGLTPEDRVVVGPFRALDGLEDRMVVQVDGDGAAEAAGARP